MWRKIRAEQDEAYKESLHIDQEKVFMQCGSHNNNDVCNRKDAFARERDGGSC